MQLVITSHTRIELYVLVTSAIIVAFLTGCAWHSQIAASKPPPDISSDKTDKWEVVGSMSKGSYGENENVIFRWGIKNCSNHQQAFKNGDFLTDEIFVIGPDEKPAPETDSGRSDMHPINGSMRGFGIYPGNVFTREGNLAELFVLTKPGTYSVSIRMLVSVSSDDKRLFLNSPPVKFTVK